MRIVEYNALQSVFVYLIRSVLIPHSEFRTMKGPYQRLKFDLRRLWECPACHRRERTAGTVTFRHCLCQIQQLDCKPIVMKLVEDGVQRLVPPVVIRHEALVAVEAEPLISSEAPLSSPDDVPIQADLPVPEEPESTGEAPLPP